MFNVTLNVFVTNDYTQLLGALNGFLGIGPCPKELEDYSFASQLLEHYWSHGYVKYEDTNKFLSFNSIEWVTNNTINNRGSDTQINGYILLNSNYHHESNFYSNIGDEIEIFEFDHLFYSKDEPN